MPSRWDAATHGWSRRVFHYPAANTDVQELPLLPWRPLSCNGLSLTLLINGVKSSLAAQSPGSWRVPDKNTAAPLVGGGRINPLSIRVRRLFETGHGPGKVSFQAPEPLCGLFRRQSGCSSGLALGSLGAVCIAVRAFFSPFAGVSGGAWGNARRMQAPADMATLPVGADCHCWAARLESR